MLQWCKKNYRFSLLAAGRFRTLAHRRLPEGRSVRHRVGGVEARRMETRHLDFGSHRSAVARPRIKRRHHLRLPHFLVPGRG